MRNKFLKDFITKSNSNNHFLDLGCGDGDNCRLIKEIFPNAKIFGVDIVEEKDAAKGIDYKKVNLENEPLPYENDFMDVIILTHVLEHLHSYYLLADEIKRVLKKNGRIYIETPNWTSTLLPSLGIKRHKHGPINFYDDPSHIKPWSRHGLYEYLNMCGVECEKVASVRSWWKLPYDPIKLIYNLIVQDRGRVSAAFANIVGWAIYAYGTKK